jgi:microcystin-dependent protein
MSDPFLGEIRMFGGNFAPQGWAFCNGAVLNISQNDALFTLFGSTYGGDGINTFGLPDLQGRAPLHVGQRPGGQPYALGQKGGSEAVAPTLAQLAIHTHPVGAISAVATKTDPTGGHYAQSTQVKLYTKALAVQYFNPATVDTAGGGAPHENMQPFQVVNFIVALAGIFPPQS